MKRQLLLFVVIVVLTATSAFAQFCSKCGAKTVNGATYCIRCGTPLPEKTAPAPAPDPAPAPPQVVPPPRPWEGPAPVETAPPPPVVRRSAPRSRPVPRTRDEIRDAYGSLTFAAFSQWRFSDDDVKSDFGLTWQYLSLEDYLVDPSRPNHLWAELGVHTWRDLGTVPNEVEIGLVNLNFGIVHFLGAPRRGEKLRTAYVLFGVGLYSASTDFPSLGLTVEEDEWGHCWGVGFITHKMKFEWRRHWVEMSPTVNYDGDQFSVGFRF